MSITQDQVIAVDGERAELDHAAHHQPDGMTQQRNLTSGRQMHQIALTEIRLEDIPKSVVTGKLT